MRGYLLRGGVRAASALPLWLAFVPIVGVTLPRYLIGSCVQQHEDQRRRIGESTLFEVSFHDRPGPNLQATPTTIVRWRVTKAEGVPEHAIGEAA